MSNLKVLMITLEPIGKSMAGPAIRCIELAKVLKSRGIETSVYSPAIESGFDTIDVLEADNSNFYDACRQFDIFVIQGNVLQKYPKLNQFNKFLVVDLYDPYLFSIISQYRNNLTSLDTIYRSMHFILNNHMASADFIICASERQRDYYIGRLCAMGLLEPKIYEQSPNLNNLIDIVPFGISENKPIQTKNVLRDVIQNISSSDTILLWGGGIWDWFDPLTVIKAIDRLPKKYKDYTKLFFMSTISPNPNVLNMSMQDKAQSLAKELDILDKNVFFNQTWIPYEQRANYFLEANIAVSAHFNQIETRFSFRTRMLDYFWAGLPIISTLGDDLSQLIENNNCGLTVDYESVDGWLNAISDLIENKKSTHVMAQNSEILKKQFYWSKVAQPLVEYCQNPFKKPFRQKMIPPNVLDKVASVYSLGGLGAVFDKIKNRVIK